MVLKGDITADLTDMENKLRLYIDKGRVAGAVEVIEEPMVVIKPDISMIKPLEKMSTFSGSYVAVDCSTRTLKRANNWGVYLMRAACALVKEREVDWSYKERLCTVVGDARTRSNFLTDVRIELESQMALGLLNERTDLSYYEHASPLSNYLLLDGEGTSAGEESFACRSMRSVRRKG